MRGVAALSNRAKEPAETIAPGGAGAANLLSQDLLQARSQKGVEHCGTKHDALQINAQIAVPGDNKRRKRRRTEDSFPQMPSTTELEQSHDAHTVSIHF
jgi:hypothetical protein